MATVRLFANLREIAGTSRVDIPAETVGDLILAANEKFGSDFASGVKVARVWVNGEAAGPEAEVMESDEVVLLPPVSGGGQPATLAPADLLGFTPIVIALVAIFANIQGQAAWAAAVVAIAAVWAVDLSIAFANRGKRFAVLVPVAAGAGGALLAHVLGSVGYGLSAGVGVAVALIWAVSFRFYREVDVLAPVALVALLGGMGTASMVLARSASAPDPQAVDVFLVASVVAIVLGSLVARLPAMPLADPFSVTAVGAVLAAVAAAAIWDLDVVAYLLAGLGIAVALVAGLGLSSMLRTGRISLSERSPGLLASLDGVVLAAAVYFPLIRLVL
ncbi:MAG: MoaD/ThiS family protein [Acidimicrobiia bacterium]|nr:MoaD/ThiS family protein [Acidimicrobiia bacterium]